MTEDYKVEYIIEAKNESVLNQLTDIVKQFAEKDRLDAEGKEIYKIFLIQMYINFMAVPYITVWTRVVNKELYWNLNKDRCVHVKDIYGHDENPYFYTSASRPLSDKVAYILDIKQF